MQGGSVSGYLALDVIEYPASFELLANIPGVRKENVILNIDGDFITLGVDMGRDASRSDAKQDTSIKWHRLERATTFEVRTIRMPDSANMEKVSAKMEDGVLKVHILKKDQPETKSRRITIASRL